MYDWQASFRLQSFLPTSGEFIFGRKWIPVPVSTGRTKTRILWISDSPHQPTGFGKASLEILIRLAHYGFHLDVIAIGADEAACAGAAWPFRMWPHPEPLPNKETIRRLILALEPAIVVTLTDPTTLPPPPGKRCSKNCIVVI